MSERRTVLDRLATRAMPRTTTTGRRLPGSGQAPTGNVLMSSLRGMNAGRSGGITAATQGISYTSPGQPLFMNWDGTNAVEAYYRSLWTMRCVRTIADTIAGLPFVAGVTARDPNSATLDCPLARLLGPPPGTPNPKTASRALWAWSIVQYILTGKFAWEYQHRPGARAGTKKIVGLWPLVSQALTPIPSFGTDHWWEGFQYQTPYELLPLAHDKVFYAWRPSQRDWRQAESPLESAATAIELQVGIERFMWGYLKQGLTAAHVVITPPFEESDMRRAWQEQFLQEFTGFDNSGRIIFGEAELNDKDQRIPQVQIQQVGTRPVDAQLLQMWQQSKIDITVAIGVPESVIGNASGRTYSNASEESKAFWTGTISNYLGELEDMVNTELAPQLGPEVGWFDVSKVVALQEPKVFTMLDAPQAVAAGIVTPQDVARILDIVSLETQAEDIETAPVGSDEGPGDLDAPDRSVAELERRARALGRSLRAATLEASADTADRVYGYLARSYPRRTLDWVHDARWERKRVPLDSIQMERRPGGRDQDKVEGIAKALKAGSRVDPAVLVNTGDGPLRIADGYHRALAHRRAGRLTMDAFVGRTATKSGPWETEMHASKKNRAMTLVDAALADPERRALLGLPPENKRLLFGMGMYSGPGISPDTHPGTIDEHLLDHTNDILNDVPPRRPEPKMPKPSTAEPPRDRPAYALPEPFAPHAFKGGNLAMCALCMSPVLAPIHVAAFSERARARPFVAAR